MFVLHVCVLQHKGAGLFCELYYLLCTLVFGDMRQKKDYQDTVTLFLSCYHRCTLQMDKCILVF